MPCELKCELSEINTHINSTEFSDIFFNKKIAESRRMARFQRMSARKNKNTKKMGLSDLIKREKEQHSKKNIEFNWPDLCKHIPKCVLYRIN